jgi:hypothetical protein
MSIKRFYFRLSPNAFTVNGKHFFVPCLFLIHQMKTILSLRLVYLLFFLNLKTAQLVISNHSILEYSITRNFFQIPNVNFL